MKVTLPQEVKMYSCRVCGYERLYKFLSLGQSPLANRFLKADQLDAPEPSEDVPPAHHACSFVANRIVKRLTLLFFAILCLSGMSMPLWGHGSKNDAKTSKAVRVYTKPPKIDGILNDDVWKYAPVATGFSQRDPNEAHPATEETAFQVAYDNEALYIAVLCSDSEPKKIVTRLYRRDQIRYEETDWVGIRLDPYHDHQTGFGFSITPSGSFADYTILNDSTLDWTWDGVWEVRTSIHNLGWSVELKIPYHALRFSPKEEYTWGINLERGISRKQEYDMWALVRRNESGISSRNGHLEGIMGIHPPAHLELLPYTVARLTVESASESLADRGQFFSNLGMDTRYGIASNISLNATLNPDFGQVEADPAVLNLSAFETYYEERRPFFIEGAGIFQTPFELFYSRRIGRQPGYFSVPAGFSVVSQPEFSTILGAAKLTGKTQGKTSFGIMEAVTAPEYAKGTMKELTTGFMHVQNEAHPLEPLTNHFVGRIQQDLLGGNSTAGVLVTAVNRKDAASAYTGGFDWNLKWRKNTYGFSGQVAGSRAGRSDDRKSGYATQFDLGKNSGWLTGGVSFRAIPPGFDANDLGFIRRADHIATGASIEMRKNQPWGPFRQMSAQLAQFTTWNYKGVNRDNIWDFGAHSNLKNYWGITVWFTRAFQTLNDWKTRGGPLIVDPAWSSYSIRIGSDSRKRVTG